GGRLSSQAQPDRVDFARDVQPILRQNCVGCHGPTVQQSRLRLDRRADAMRGGNTAVIGPGNSAGSRLYLRLIGTEYGPQMPPTGALKPGQVGMLKDWIDQGAEWPDELSGETPARPTPPLMTSVLTGTVAEVRRLLDTGADPDAANDAGATALMWAVWDDEKTRLLVEYGADVNAISNDGRTPLIIASAVHGGARRKDDLAGGTGPRAAGRRRAAAAAVARAWRRRHRQGRGGPVAAAAGRRERSAAGRHHEDADRSRRRPQGDAARRPDRDRPRPARG
ncbi:MAG: ankyrin repeat domain-containing protein, partial [Acidobacteriia bacterium]|nr:ankyrin repeat domain-containing protein [Terriglobia bacterium]